MNFKNLMMWGLIVFLAIGLFNLFQNPQKTSPQGKEMAFSSFLKEVNEGRVVEVEIQGNDINGKLANGKNFKTYAPNDTNIVEILTKNGVTITASPIEDKMPS